MASCRRYADGTELFGESVLALPPTHQVGATRLVSFCEGREAARRNFETPCALGHGSSSSLSQGRAALECFWEVKKQRRDTKKKPED